MAKNKENTETTEETKAVANGRKILAVTLPVEAHKKLRFLSALTGTPMAEMARNVLVSSIDEQLADAGVNVNFDSKGRPTVSAAD